MISETDAACQLPWTGERYVPEVEGEIELEHLHRYALARDLAYGKDVLDIACGEGYGSALLASVARSVTGVDISEETIAHASRRYDRGNLSFAVGSCASIPLADASVDLVVSFETIEHHDKHLEMMAEIRRVLRTDGVLIISSPDKHEYSDVPGSKNEYHIKELYLSEFTDLLASHFAHIRMFGQRIYFGSLVAPADGRASRFASYSRRDESFRREPGVIRPVYFIALASNAALPEIQSGLYDGTSYLGSQFAARDRQLAERDAQIASSTQAVAERDAQITSFVQAVAERDAAIATRDGQIAELIRAVEERNQRIGELLSSTSWRLMASVRMLKTALGPVAGAPVSLRQVVGRRVHRAYLALPLPPASRVKIKDFAFLRLGWLMRRTSTYRSWEAAREIAREQAASRASADASRALLSLPRESSQVEWQLPAPYDPESDAEVYAALSSQLEILRRSCIEQHMPSRPDLLSFQGRDLEREADRIVLATCEAPSVSIVVPVYNHIRLTLECLASIAAHTAGLAYEVIVADDCSTDETESVLSRVRGLRYLRNEANLGFLRNCNRALADVRGGFVVLLNNDVQVTAKWLSSLLSTFERFDRVGAVGPKILYPNGRLQEAGARLNCDCSSQLIGAGDNPALERYNEVREVDYCSGACLAMRTEVWQAAGGFDERYLPAYCEDVDLCFRLRELGMRVMYNPASVIVHHLSVTSNAMDQGFKIRCILRNQQKLAERWQAEIDHLNTVRLIAFYLPQFHPVPENDLWWGKGFTEWSNVAKARPNFVGHYQPHLPADLGFYDLRIAEIMEQQAALARRYGLYGFCFYYYSFSGRRILEMPVQRLLATGRPAFPFCLCWANENWTRRWDGKQQEILLAQHYSDTDDRTLIEEVAPYFASPDYIRIDGRPVFLLYRADLLPDVERTTHMWRTACRALGVGEIYLAMVESFDYAIKPVDPRSLGFDASVEFPPHHMAAEIAPPGTLLNPRYGGVVSDYRAMVGRALQKPVPGYPRFRGIMPSWDNTARQQDASYIFANASPGAYRAWLEAILAQTREQNFGDERIVFVNAWNEWAEGTHLEPDRQFGHGYLQATRDALEHDLIAPARPRW